jgi:endoglucanase
VLGEAAVDATAGASEAGGATTRGAGDSTLVTGGLAVLVGEAGATGVITGAVVVCVTGGGGGSTGSTACCGWGGASTLGATGRAAGAFGGGGSCGGASASSGVCTFGSGAGAVVVTT